MTPDLLISAALHLRAVGIPLHRIAEHLDVDRADLARLVQTSGHVPAGMRWIASGYAPIEITDYQPRWRVP